ncbi:SDR family oxidoreductase [Spirosoma harenae]
MNLSNNKILITGGASGIGLGMTERFVQEGNTVIICGRREDVLQEVVAKFPGVISRACDLSVAEERQALYQWIADEHSDLNVLVNNAGIQQWTSITDDDFMDRAKAEIAVNIEAPLHLTSLFVKLPSLTTILNVTSGLAFAPLAKVPVYSATKAFFRSFTWSLRALVKAQGIEVIEVIPPALNTDLGGKGLHDHAPPVSGFIDAIIDQLKLGKTELTYGTSETRANGSADDLRNYFNQMNASV